MENDQSTLHKDFSEQKEVSVGVLSDTHSFINPDVLEQLNTCSLILHAGDIGSINVIKQLKKITIHVISVRGNNDIPEKWASEEHAELANIARIAEIQLPGGSIALTHGDQHHAVATRHKKLRQQFSNAKAIIYGHSHEMVCDQSHDPWVLNPGAAGKSKIRMGVSCLLITANKQEWRVSEFRAPSTR